METIFGIGCNLVHAFDEYLASQTEGDQYYSVCPLCGEGLDEDKPFCEECEVRND